MAGIFIYGGIDALRDPQSKAKAADNVAPLIAEALQLPTTDTVTLVRINGAIQLAAGTMLALGKARRLSALVLAASLVPTTYAGHRFWEAKDDEQREQQRIQFLKNLSMLGGLVLAAGDTGGRPSIPWQARRAATHAIESAAAVGSAVSAAGAAQKADLSRRAVKATRKAAKTALTAEKAQKAQFVKLSRRAMKAARKAGHAELGAVSNRAQRAASDLAAAHPVAQVRDSVAAAYHEVAALHVGA